MGLRLRALLWLPLLLACGCHTLGSVVQSFQYEPPQAKPVQRKPAPEMAQLGCEFMTVMIDYSREGNSAVGERVAKAMTKEFKALGTRVTRSSDEAYWSLMILASENSRKDGYVFSAMLSARNMNEGYDPGVTVYQRNGEVAPEASQGEPTKIPTLYNGLSYGPYDVLETQARAYVRQAYAAVYPFAQKLCAFEAVDRKREESIDDQLPAGPAPL